MPDTHLAAIGETGITITRAFAAPPDRVFAALTQSDQILQWMGTPDYPTIECDLYLAPGGHGRQVWGKPGKTIGVTYRFLEIEPPRRLVHSELWDDDWTQGECLVTTSLSPTASGTDLQMLLEYSTRAVRDAVLASPMVESIRINFENLDRLLAG